MKKNKTKEQFYGAKTFIEWLDNNWLGIHPDGYEDTAREYEMCEYIKKKYKAFHKEFFKNYDCLKVDSEYWEKGGEDITELMEKIKEDIIKKLEL